ncbi:hypothetical protein FRC02_005450 [Tulasnella sp. 418]|nr:hypothetical protein FRC02_005450 [Tulasnella sp. 418]
MIVTGGNTGIGKETAQLPNDAKAQELLEKNAEVYMGSRSKERAEAAISELKEETGKEAIFLQLDLANLDAVRRDADEFKSGLGLPPIDQLTTDRYDVQFGTNVLGHAHFTLCLIPELLEGAKASPDGKARVIHTSSSGAYMVGSDGIQYNTLRGAPARRKLGSQALYFQSKYGS